MLCLRCVIRFTLSLFLLPATYRRRSLPVCLVLLIAAAGLSAQEQAKAGARRWNAEAGAGLEYDTNVSVDEVDLSSGRSDHARVLDLQVGVRQTFSEDTQFSLDYSISQSDYREFDRVDRLTQIVGADLSSKLGKGSAAVSAHYIDSRLDGERFLSYTRFSPAYSRFLARQWFARAAYVYAERSIDGRTPRNATTQSGEVDLYYLHRGLRSYFNLGYRYRDEDTIAPELDFTAHGLKLRYIRRFNALGRKAKAELACRYEERDYSSPEPTIDTPRRDDRLRWKVDFEIPVKGRFTWQAYYSYGDFTSNLPRADFTQTIIGTRLQYRW